MATKAPPKATAAGSSMGAAAGGLGTDPTMTAKELAAAKRQKKREVDRRCQREARQRTKARIAYLEELVDELRQQDTSGQVASLMEQVSAARTERDQFARTLRGIEDAIRGHQTALADAGAAVAKQEPESPDEDVLHGAIVGSSAHGIAAIPAYDVTMDMDGATYDESTLPASSSRAMPPNPPFAVAPSISATMVPRPAAPPPLIRRDLILPQTEPCPSCEPQDLTHRQPPSLWRFANEVLHAAPHLTARELQWDDECADDTPVRAAVEGWDAVEKRLGGHLPRLWRALRRIDEGIYQHIGPIERLAIMRTIHRLYRYHADPATQRATIPPWLIARPSQNIEHAYGIDFICWPGVRERLVFAEHSYCTDVFWHLLNTSLRILWQYDFRDCYVVDRRTHAYRVAPAFDARIADINAWAMGPAFFQPWPELYADIPSWERAALPMDRIGGGGGGGGTRSWLLQGRPVLPGGGGGGKLMGIVDHPITNTNMANGGGGDDDDDDETDADAEGIDDDDEQLAHGLVVPTSGILTNGIPTNGLPTNGIHRPNDVDAIAAAAAAAAGTTPLVGRGGGGGVGSLDTTEWLWLQGVVTDGMDTTAGHMGGGGGGAMGH